MTIVSSFVPSAITQPFFEQHTPDFTWKFVWTVRLLNLDLDSIFILVFSFNIILEKDRNNYDEDAEASHDHGALDILFE